VRPAREKLLAAVAAYNSWLDGENRKRKPNDPHPKQHAATWLMGEVWNGFAGEPALSPAEIEINKDRADRLMRRGKYAVNYR